MLELRAEEHGVTAPVERVAHRRRISPRRSNREAEGSATAAGMFRGPS